MWILLVFLAIPILEIALFVQIGAQLGVIGTLAEIFATAAIGLVLIRLEPHRNAQDVRAALDRDASPASPMAHSAIRMIGAVLFVLPGFFTDLVGFLLLLPPVRTLVLTQLFKNLRSAHRRQETVIIEGDYEHRPDTDIPTNRRLDDPEKRD